MDQGSNPKEEQRHIRNKQAAKQSRLRKKLYFDLLEHTADKKQKQYKQLLADLEERKQQVTKLNARSQTMIAFAIGRQHAVKKLQKILEGKEECTN